MPEQEFLPKEKLDLPLPQKDLPPPPQQAQPQSQNFQEKTTEFLGMKSPQNVAQMGEYKTLLSWHAPGRPFRVRSRAYYINVVLIALLVEIILFLFGQYMLMGLVGALVFMVFALAFVPPVDFHYSLTTEGVLIEDRFFLWIELYDFYFKHEENMDVLVIRTHSYFPGEIYLPLGQMHKEHLKTVVIPYLPYREFITPTFMDKAGEWLKKKVPLDHAPSRA